MTHGSYNWIMTVQAVGDVRPLGPLKEPFSGLSHLAGFLVSLFAGGLLVGATRDIPGAVTASVVFAASMAVLYLASATYHLVHTNDLWEHRLNLIDRAAIFVMIAGTSTPYFFHGYEGETRVMMLSVIWGLAIAGVVFKLFWLHSPRWFYVALYLAMGWVSVLKWEETVAGLPSDVLAWLIAGGVAYTVGAVVYALKRPNFTQDFGFHELWHLFVLAGTTAHYVGIYLLATQGA